MNKFYIGVAIRAIIVIACLIIYLKYDKVIFLALTLLNLLTLAAMLITHKKRMAMQQKPTEPGNNEPLS
jgi:hypothetical protein